MSSTSLPLIRPLAIPVEHGAWGFLFEPIVLGLLVAPSPAGALIGIGGLAVFLFRHPLQLAARDWQKRRYPRTAVCEALAGTYALAAAITLGTALASAGWRPMLPLLFALPFGVAQFIYDFRKHNRALIAELCGAIAPAALLASILLAGGKPPIVAASLAALVLGRSIPAVLYVRSVLRGESRIVMIGAHLAAIGIAVFVSWTAVVAMVLLLGRALMPANGVRPQTIGMRELAWGAVFVVLTAAGFYF